MEETGNHSDALVERDIFVHHPFRQAVEDDDRKGDQEVVLTHGVLLRHEPLLNPILTFPLLEYGAATLADSGIFQVLAHMSGIVPATLAFTARSFADLDVHAGGSVTRGTLQLYRRNNKQEP